MTARYQPFDQTVSQAYQDATILSAPNTSFSDSRSSVKVNLHAGTAIRNLASSSHHIAINSKDIEQGSYDISLAKKEVKADKTFVLEWQLNPSTLPQVSQFSEQVGDQYFTLLTFFPTQYTG